MVQIDIVIKHKIQSNQSELFKMHDSNTHRFFFVSLIFIKDIDGWKISLNCLSSIINKHQNRLASINQRKQTKVIGPGVQ